MEVACKLRLTLIGVTNYKLKVANEKKLKKNKMIKKQKKKIIAIRYQKAIKKSVNLVLKKIHQNDIRDETDSNKGNDACFLHFKKVMKEKL